jgi:hypothetical protein
MQRAYSIEHSKVLSILMPNNERFSKVLGILMSDTAAQRSEKLSSNF